MISVTLLYYCIVLLLLLLLYCIIIIIVTIIRNQLSKDKGKRKIVKAGLEYNFEFSENAKILKKKANNSAIKIKKV